MQIQGQYAISGGTFYNSSAVEEVAQIKSSAGLFFGIMVTNFNASARYIYVFDNTASSGTIIVPPIPLAAAASLGAATVIAMPWAIPFSTGLRIATSSTGGTFTASAGSDVRMSVLYK